MRILLLLVIFHCSLWSAAQKDPMAKREAKVRRQLANDRPYKAISLATGALGIEARPVFHVLRADARNRIGEFAEAERDARVGLRARGDDREALLQLAIAEQGLGKTDSAVLHFRELLDMQADPRAHYRLGTALQDNQDYPAAIVELEKALALSPPNDPAIPRIQRIMAEGKALSGDTAGARAAFQRALELVPHDPVTLNSRAWFLFAAHDEHAKAIRDYDLAIKQNPNYSYAFNNRGWSRFKLGDVAGGVKDIQLARKKKPFNPYIYRNLGIIALHRGDMEDACAQFHRALELNFTAVHGEEVEQLLVEHCRSREAQPRQEQPGTLPADPKPITTPARTNAPE